MIVSCVHWLFSNHSDKITSNLQLIELILSGLVKKVYCIERSVEFNSESEAAFISKELLEAIEVALMSLKWVSQPRLIENILNVLMSAVPNGVPSSLKGIRFPQIFVDSFSHAFDFFASYYSSQDSSDAHREREFVQVIIFSVSYLRSKLDLLLSKNL